MRIASQLLDIGCAMVARARRPARRGDPDQNVDRQRTEGARTTVADQVAREGAQVTQRQIDHPHTECMLARYRAS